MTQRVSDERLDWARKNHDEPEPLDMDGTLARDILLDYLDCRAKLEAAERELSLVDGALARRPAIADEVTRYAKIEKACRVAGDADIALRTVDGLREKLADMERRAEQAEKCNATPSG